MSESPLVPQENQPKKGNTLFTVLLTLASVLFFTLCCCLPMFIVTWNALPDLRAKMSLTISDMFHFEWIDAHEADTETNYIAPPAVDNDFAFEGDFQYLPEGLCVFGGGTSSTWQGGPSNLNYVGFINQSSQEAGFSQQAFLEKWTTQDRVAGYSYPKGRIEAGNDGLQLEVCRKDGRLLVFMPRRDANAIVPFHQISYTQLVGSELLVCYKDTGNPGDWNGECDGATEYIHGVSLNDFSVPGDLTTMWTNMQNLLFDYRGEYRMPAYGEMLFFWVKP